MAEYKSTVNLLYNPHVVEFDESAILEAMICFKDKPPIKVLVTSDQLPYFHHRTRYAVETDLFMWLVTPMGENVGVNLKEIYSIMLRRKDA